MSGSPLFLICILRLGEIFDVLLESFIVGVDILHVLSVLFALLL